MTSILINFSKLGSSDIPARIFFILQNTKTFTGEFKKSFMAFERTWTGSCAIPEQDGGFLAFSMPQIPIGDQQGRGILQSFYDR